MRIGWAASPAAQCVSACGNAAHGPIAHSRAPSPAAATADEWYERAKKATDRCDLELTYQTTGAKNGLADKVVWVTGLFDLNRNELTDFKRPLQEYYDRFNRILDRGACGRRLAEGADV